MRLENKTALVTGGGTGIGRAIATRFAREGAKVAISGRRIEKLEGTAQLIREAGGEPVIIQGNVANEEDASRMIKESIDQMGWLDILVNNAATILSRTTLSDTPLDAWDGHDGNQCQ